VGEGCHWDAGEGVWGGDLRGRRKSFAFFGGVDEGDGISLRFNDYVCNLYSQGSTLFFGIASHYGGGVDLGSSSWEPVIDGIDAWGFSLADSEHLSIYILAPCWAQLLSHSTENHFWNRFTVRHVV
jgi:hypothetical protein